VRHLRTGTNGKNTFEHILQEPAPGEFHRERTPLIGQDHLVVIPLEGLPVLMKGSLRVDLPVPAKNAKQAPEVIVLYRGLEVHAVITGRLLQEENGQEVLCGSGAEDHPRLFRTIIRHPSGEKEVGVLLLIGFEGALLVTTSLAGEVRLEVLGDHLRQNGIVTVDHRPWGATLPRGGAHLLQDRGITDVSHLQVCLVKNFDLVFVVATTWSICNLCRSAVPTRFSSTPAAVW